jgi:eukaryotic-like serine/threonine-protein kinase
MGSTSGPEGPKTETGSTLGTPSYMAPEQATGDRNIDHRADIWSLGVIAYECLSGARPIEGENPTQMMLRLLSSGIMPIERLVPQLPEGWASLIGRMLSRDAGRRPSDLREVYDVLAASTARRCPTFGAPGSEEPLTPLAVSGTAGTAAAGGSRRGRTAFLIGSLSLIGATALVRGQIDERTPGEASSGEPAIAATLPIRDEPARAGTAPPASEPAAEPTIAPSPAVTPASQPERPTATAGAASGTAPEKRSKSRRSSAPSRPPDGLPPGAACERSEECRSGYCVALSCR